MGWKSVKDHYHIKHNVQVTADGMCIGSAYIHDIIVFKPWRKEFVKRYDSGNEDLARIQREMDADLDKLWELAQSDDVFEVSIPVYTWKGSEILERQCEKLGWPNVTHDGEMMYENTFSTDRSQVLQWAIRDAEAIAQLGFQRLSELDNDRIKVRKRIDDAAVDLAKLRHEQLLAAIAPAAQ